MKITKGESFRSDYMSLKQSKSIQAICALLIILHHISLKLCDKYSVPAEYLKHGLEPFMYIGYLCVAVFFFYSGYGVYRSLHEKEEYLKDFLFKRLTPIFVVHVLITFVYMVISNLQDVSLHFQSPFTLFGPNTNNPYAWFIYAIVLCYILFFNAFKRIKNEAVSIGIIIAGLLLYIIFCNYWLYGGWWYNTILVFPFGIIYAKYEEAFQSRMRSHYKQWLIVDALLGVLGFIGAEFLSSALMNTDYLVGYSIGQLILALLRTLTSILFVLFIVLIVMKVRVEHKALTFLGGLTLEIYLVHGIFVQAFAFEYLSGYETAVCYIANPFLYVVLVFVLTIAVAYILNLAGNVLFVWIKNELRGVYKKALIVIGLILAGIIVLVTVKTYMEDQKYTEERADEYSAYIAEQNFVQISDGKMAYFTQGEGEHTIVVMGSINDPSSTIVMQYISKFLSAENKVCVFDYLGRGLSDDYKCDRTAENIARELHEALEILDFDDQYILMPCDYSGTYALKYIEMYPDEVEGLIGVDMMIPGLYETYVQNSGISVSAYEEATQKSYNHADFWRKVSAKFGYSRWIFHVYESLWMSYSLKDIINITEETYAKNQHRDTVIEEQRLFGQNCSQIDMSKLPEDMPVLMIVDYGMSRAKIGKAKVITPYYDLISNEEIQRVRIMEGDRMLIYYQGSKLSQMINDYLHTNW